MKLTRILSSVITLSFGQLCQAPQEYAARGNVYQFHVHKGKVDQYQIPGGPPIEPAKSYSIKRLKKLMKKCKVKGPAKLADGDYVAYGRIQKNKFEPLNVPQQFKLDQISGTNMCGVHLSKCPTIASVASKMDKARGTKQTRAVFGISLYSILYLLRDVDIMSEMKQKARSYQSSLNSAPN